MLFSLPPPPFPFPSVLLSLLPFLPPSLCLPLPLCLPTPTNPELEVSLQEALIKPISLSLRQAALCLCKRTGSFPLGVRWALRRGGAADFSRFSDWKTTDSKEVYPSWVIASWHPWTSSGFRLSPLRGSEEGRQRLKPSLPWGGRKQMCSLRQPPQPQPQPQPAAQGLCDSGFLARAARYLVSPFPLARCFCGPLTGLGSPSISTRQLPCNVLFSKGGSTSRKC